jgi:flagellar basal-body rod protein FlgB
VGIALARGYATVNDITDASLMAALGRRMTDAVARETVAASNLANLDTPGYRTLEATFEESLHAELGALPVARTAGGHLTGIAPASAATHAAEGLSARRDGNTVQLDRELLALNRAAGDFSAAQTALAAKFRLVRYAINEGR